MKAVKLARELRRIARREVPAGEPDLWPAIQRQIVSGTSNTNGLMPSGEQHRSGSSRRADLSSEYVWQADAPRRRRFGTVSRALGAGLTLVLVVAVLAVALGNRDRDEPTIGAGVTASPTAAMSAGIGTPTSTASWSSGGALTIPIVPVAGSDVSGTINVQVMPGGDLRLANKVRGSTDILFWHAVAVSCDRASADAPSKTDLAPSFSQSGGYYWFIPAIATHQTIAIAALRFSDGSLAACASLPPVPAGLTPHFAAASEIPSTCPVTLPGQVTFSPPDVSAAPPNQIYGDYWYGDNDLWTSLPFDGVWNAIQNGGKSFWWSQSYNFMQEQNPALTVSGKRLDGDAPSVDFDQATNGTDGGVGAFMLIGVDFPTTGCWQVTGAYKGHSLSFVVWVDQVAQSGISTPVPTQTAIPSLAACPVEPVLSRFVEAFNSDDQATLTAMLPEEANSGNGWLAAVAGGEANASNPTIDTVALTRDDFLSYVAIRHAQGEQLVFENVVTTESASLPDQIGVVADLQRQANDLLTRKVRVVAIISCDTQQIDSWSLGDPVDGATASTLTGDQLIEDTLRDRQLSPRINDDLTDGSCPAMTPHSVNPALSPALGGGPLYVVMGDADSNGVLHLSSRNSDDGWVDFKVIWTSDPSYQGPVLVRGVQVGGTNVMRFGDINPPDPDLYFTAPHGNDVEITYTRVNAPGCYAYQVDGINFSEVIVINVQP